MSRPCSTDFCVCIPQDNDIANCDEDYMTKSFSCGEEDAVVCHSDWVHNISPSIVCNQDGLIQELDIIKNPNEIGLKNDDEEEEEFHIWSCNSVEECNQRIPDCRKASGWLAIHYSFTQPNGTELILDFSPSPTSLEDVGGDSPSMSPNATSSSNEFTTALISPEMQMLLVVLSIFVIAFIN